MMNEYLQAIVNKIWFKIPEKISYISTTLTVAYDFVLNGSLNSILLALFTFLSIGFLSMRMYHQFLQTLKLKREVNNYEDNKQAKNRTKDAETQSSSEDNYYND